QRQAPGQAPGGPWRPLRGVACRRSCLAPLGPLLQGTRASVDLLGRGLACLAAGLGLRGPARVCAVAPPPVRQGLGAAAGPLRAVSQPFVHARRGWQGPRAEVWALRRASRAGAGSEPDALEGLERAPPWGGGAMAPARTRRLARDGGERPRARAQRLVPPVTPGLAPAWPPLWL